MYAKLGKTKTGTLTYLLISDMYIYISPHCYDPFYCECFEQFCFCFVFGFLLSHSLVAIICVYTISLALNDGLFSLLLFVFPFSCFYYFLDDMHKTEHDQIYIYIVTYDGFGLVLMQ